MKQDISNIGNEVFKRGKYTITIRESVLNIFSHYKQLGKRKEAGGILLGQVKGNNIYVLKASIPNCRDISKRFGFTRDKKNAQLIIDHEFYNSGKRTIYLGEWHTHPENDPTPSSVDRKMIRGQFDGSLNEPLLIMIVVGTKKLNLSLYNGKKIIT